MLTICCGLALYEVADFGLHESDGKSLMTVAVTCFICVCAAAFSLAAVPSSPAAPENINGIIVSGVVLPARIDQFQGIRRSMLFGMMPTLLVSGLMTGVCAIGVVMLLYIYIQGVTSSNENGYYIFVLIVIIFVLFFLLCAFAVVGFLLLSASRHYTAFREYEKYCKISWRLNIVTVGDMLRVIHASDECHGAAIAPPYGVPVAQQPYAPVYVPGPAPVQHFNDVPPSYETAVTHNTAPVEPK